MDYKDRKWSLEFGIWSLELNSTFQPFQITKSFYATKIVFLRSSITESCRNNGF
jgi:hypothetical protein